jgi:hypothetical protein
MGNSTGSPVRKKAHNRLPKPYDDFPLSPNCRGYWVKKINGNIRTFGRWGKVVSGVVTKLSEDGDWATALKLYEAQREDVYAGREPRAMIVNGEPKRIDEGMTLKELCNRFLTFKHKGLSKKPRPTITQRKFTELNHAVASYEDRLYSDVQLAARRSLAAMTLESRLTNRHQLRGRCKRGLMGEPNVGPS